MGRRLSVLCGSTQILLTRHAHSMELTRKLYYSSLLSYFSISVGVFRNVGSTSRVLPTALRLENIETLSHSRRIPVASSTNHIQVCTLRFNKDMPQSKSRMEIAHFSLEPLRRGASNFPRTGKRGLRGASQTIQGPEAITNAFSYVISIKPNSLLVMIFVVLEYTLGFVGIFVLSILCLHHGRHIFSQNSIVQDGLNKPVHDETSPLVSVAETTGAEDHRVDNSGEREFGGAIGVSGMMIGFPLLMYYMWIGATFYSGHIPSRTPGQSWDQFFSHLFDLCYEHAFPHTKAWTIYWTFLIFEGACYLYMPGVYGKGKRLPSLGGKQLEYYCSAVWSWYTTIILAIVFHFSGLFPLYTLIDEFGSIMSVAIISGFVVSIIAYFSALSRGAEHRMTGSPIYDFFMGAELNPRLFTWLDFKMFFEVRIPWYILFLTTLGACARQYETYGYVSGEAWFLLMAHFLYANACSKGEELIITSWDMYFEKWGFMLIFWNLAGVPLSYCHCTLYIANHDPSEYAWPTWALTLLFVAYLFVYWIWDTANSQKNMFRAQERGVALNRKTFPQLPYKAVKNPVSIKTKTGDSILCDGWYGKARKIHYTCDLFFALSWGAITGFNSPFPWFYPLFFSCMIVHRAIRDIQKCRAKYGDAWMEYEKRVPWLFIPVGLRLCCCPGVDANVLLQYVI
ncbi:sterol reductase/lamin B receptor [Aureobasidium subglaciale]|nr:sterol reductase/lamin B receptor [Aureobasidium subglaciale]KAI5213655.1 sterol reductase/lamin B receptor [Aureobasidium subglaciale]KAI5215378.1 sterol reductase/lamin B receptor [Aureobasidium subglaciale]KAI5253307.1 sterol reductase/lamin B receptor [Aureobasidium subglaciale]